VRGRALLPDHPFYCKDGVFRIWRRNIFQVDGPTGEVNENESPTFDPTLEEKRAEVIHPGFEPCWLVRLKA